MADELLPYYEKELAYIRQMGSEFANEHPKIAGRLGVGGDTVEDPHVSRLIEGFAYLNSRIQHKLDDDFPELTDALLNVVFPHYQRPLPSLAITQFTPDETQLDAKYTIKKGTLLETERFKGEHCKFNLCYDVNLFPVRIKEAQLMGKPFTTPGADKMRGASAVLKLSLETYSADISIADLSIDKLRMFLRGQAQHVHPLYQKLLSECEGIVLSNPQNLTKPKFIGRDKIKHVGFNIDEGVLPYPPSSFIGYRLLTEYFAYPDKFMFVDLCDIDSHLPEGTNQNLDIYIYLTTTDIELEHSLDENTFALGCSPMINLFDQKADPIRLDHTQNEYQVIPDSRRPKGFEVYSIEQVTASTSAGEKIDYLPFYGLNHDNKDRTEHAFWFGARRNSKLGYQERDDGTDVFLSLVDLGFNPNIIEEHTLTLQLMCSNRDQPGNLPYNLENPKLQCIDSAPPCTKIRCITQPGKTIRPPLRNNARWRLLSHLNLNHLSLTGGESAKDALKEILRLYDFKNSSVTKGLIDSIMSVRARQISAPLNIDGNTTMCRGIEVEVVLDDALLAGSSNYLYATVLEHFFALYCSVNSFSRVLIKINNKEGYLKKCSPRAGERVFL